MKNKKGGKGVPEPAIIPPADGQEDIETHGGGTADMEEDTRPVGVSPEGESDETDYGESDGGLPAHEETERQRQPHHQYHQYQPPSLPPGYAIEPATGRIFQIAPQQPLPEAAAEMEAARQQAAQQRHGQIVHSVEQFLEGKATVSDVVKTLYMNTTQDDQLWKGVIVGAAAAVLLTSKPVRQAMGKTLGGVLPGLKDGGAAKGKAEKK